MIELPFKPVVIIGAARSGTNMLRDILTSLPGIDTWPCDEIPFIWRRGNRSHPDDEFAPAMARPGVIDNVRRAFRRAAGHETRILIEKTCANSLRVSFVDRILPDAHFIHIVRDGRDASASAMLRWRADFDLRYSLAKARFVPLTDLPFYGIRFLTNRLSRSRSQENRLEVWGPVFSGMRALPPDTPLHEVAARQWTRCLERSDAAFDTLDSDRVTEVRYETFVQNPARELERIIQDLGHTIPKSDIVEIVGDVRSNSINKAMRTLPVDQLADMEKYAGSMLVRHGYTLSRDAPARSGPALD